VRPENWGNTHHGITLPHDDMVRRLDSIDMAGQELVDLNAKCQCGARCSGVPVIRCSRAQSTHLVRAVAADDDHLSGDAVGVDDCGGGQNSAEGWSK
jgi:hypothetical protein